jgi:hypothetical protein
MKWKPGWNGYLMVFGGIKFLILGLMNPQMDMLRIKPSILGVNAFDFWPIPSWLFHSIDSPTGQSGSFLSRTMICIAKFLFELNSRHDSAIKICRFALPTPPKLPSNSPTCLPRWEFHHEMFLHIFLLWMGHEVRDCQDLSQELLLWLPRIPIIHQRSCRRSTLFSSNCSLLCQNNLTLNQSEAVSW